MSRPGMDWCQLEWRLTSRARRHAVPALERVRAVAYPLCSAETAQDGRRRLATGRRRSPNRRLQTFY